MDIKISWLDFKQAVDSNNTAITYISTQGNYYLYTTLPTTVQLVCVLLIGSSDAVFFEDNYLDNSTSIV